MAVVERRLYNEEKEITEKYTYQINSLGCHEPDVFGEVVIIFINGKFKEARYPFAGMYTKGQWEVLGAIAKKIGEIDLHDTGEILMSRLREKNKV